MGKSLTETAKEVMELQENQKQLSEGDGKNMMSHVPYTSTYDKDPDRDGGASNANRSTLKPGSKHKASRFKNDNANSEGLDSYDDLGGQTPTSLPKDNLGAKAANKVDKDKSKSSMSPVSSEKIKKLSEELDELSEEEINEALDDIINEMIKEGLTEEEIDVRLDEAFGSDEEVVTEEEELPEEITDFIDDCIAEGLDEEEIQEALSEALDSLDEEQLDEISSKLPQKYFQTTAELRDKKEAEYRAADHANAQAAHLGMALKEKPGNRKARLKKAMRSGKQKREWKNARQDFDTIDEEEITSESFKVDMREHVDALLSGENLSEEFRDKATTIFESAINTKLEEEVAILEETYAAALKEEVEKIEEQLAEDIENYLDYLSEKWLEENRVAIEPSLKSELTDDFIVGLRNLFAEHYIDIPEDKVDILESLGEKVEKLEERLNEEIENNVNLTKELNEAVRNEVIADICENLTDTQAAKIEALAENIDFTTADEFADKVHTLKESYFPSKAPVSEPLDRVEPENDGKGVLAEELNGPMAHYVKSLGKTLPK